MNILFVYKTLYAVSLERHLNLGPPLKRIVPPNKRSNVLTGQQTNSYRRWTAAPCFFLTPDSSTHCIAMCCLKGVSRTAFQVQVSFRMYKTQAAALFTSSFGRRDTGVSTQGLRCMGQRFTLNYTPFCCFVRWKFLFSFSYTL